MTLAELAFLLAVIGSVALATRTEPLVPHYKGPAAIGERLGK